VLSAQLHAPMALVLDLLDWVGRRTRTYDETIDAWRTSCPRLPVWEDAVENGLIAIVADEAHGALTVALTEKGRAWIGERGG
jgi:hypothetical protein